MSAADAPDDAPRVLVLARDVLLAGLLGALVEADDGRPLFPAAGERADVAARRLRPAVALVELPHPAARSAAFLDAMRDVGGRVVVFAAGEPWADLADALRGRPHATLVAAGPGESLGALIRRALRDDPGARPGPAAGRPADAADAADEGPPAA